MVNPKTSKPKKPFQKHIILKTINSKDLTMSKNEGVSISVLEKTAAAQVLLYLFFNQQGVNRRDLLKNVEAASDTLDSTLEFLKLNGLVNEDKIKSFPPERKFTLTELGLKVAQPLSVIAEALHNAESLEDTSTQ